MEIKEPTSKVVRVRADSLAVHPHAQRELSATRLAKLVDKLDLDAIGVLHGVQYPINSVVKIWIIDGQHRLAALMEYGCESHEVEVKIHMECDSDERAAELFLMLNDRLKVTPYDKFRNEVQAGIADSVIINRLVRECGLEVSRNPGQHRVSSVNALKLLFAMDRGPTLSLALKVAIAAWGSTPDALNGNILEGLGQVLSRYRLTIEQDTLIRKLEEYPGRAIGLLADAKGLAGFNKTTVSKSVADHVLKTYNKSRKAGVLPSLESVAAEA